MTKRDMIDLLEPFTDEIQLKLYIGGLLKPISAKYRMDYTTGHVGVIEIDQAND
jgi:hypothetical protein